MMQRLQPYRVESAAGPGRRPVDGLLRAHARSQPRADGDAHGSAVPAAGQSGRPQALVHAAGNRHAARGPGRVAWSRDRLGGRPARCAGVAESRARGECASPNPTAAERLVRLAYAASNEQPYRSVGSWLLQQGALRDASWPGIKAWAAQNPQRVNEMLWSNPRTVFFREEPLSASSTAAFGPRGAQGVPLTPGRSIAVDKDSIPYGTPVWLVSSGPVVESAATGVGAGHRQRHRRRRACGLFHRVGAAGGRGGRPAQAAVAPVGAVAEVTRQLASATRNAWAAPHNCGMKFLAIGLLAAGALSGCVSAPPAVAPVPARAPATEPVPATSPTAQESRQLHCSVIDATRTSNSACASPTTPP